jgi:hypothetical protein
MMTILEKKRYRPKLVDELRKYTRIERYEGKSKFGENQSTIGVFRVDYFNYSNGLDELDEELVVRWDVIKDGFTAWDLNEIQMEYAVTKYNERKMELSVVPGEANKVKIEKKKITLREIIEDLRDWFIDNGGIPEIYYEVAEDFKGTVFKDPVDLVRQIKSETERVVELVKMAHKSPQTDAHIYESLIKDESNYSRIFNEKFLQSKSRKNRFTEEEFRTGAMIWWKNPDYDKRFKKNK